MRIFTIVLILFLVACNSGKEKNTKEAKEKPESEITFDEAKWQMRDGKDYPFRDKMLNDIVYNDTVRSLNKTKITNLLGSPDRINENYFYYKISQVRLGFWPLHTKTMVIKFSESDSIEWIKIHK